MLKRLHSDELEYIFRRSHQIEMTYRWPFLSYQDSYASWKTENSPDVLEKSWKFDRITKIIVVSAIISSNLVLYDN